MTRQQDITTLFQQWQEGDSAALDQLMPLVYTQLKQIASRSMSQESQQHTLQTTALVNELYLKLMSQSVHIHSRGQFFALCATVIRNLLVDHARGKNRDKRWGQLKQVTLGEDASNALDNDEFLALNDALDRLQRLDPMQQQYLMLHYFAGLSYDEVAEVSEVSRATVGRELKMAKAWLSLQMKA